jgi:hypothetical protein
VDRIADLLADLPIGLIIFIIALAFGMFGRDDKKKQAQSSPRQATRQPGQPAAPSIFASDDRRAREQRRAEEQGEVITFGGLDFGRPGSLFDERNDDVDNRDSQWGQTKYGFDESEWGSAFGDRKNQDPIIR